MDALHRRVATEAHALSLRDYIRSRFVVDPTTLVAHDTLDRLTSADLRKNSAFRTLCSRMTPLAVEVTRLNGDHTLSESIEKLIRFDLTPNGDAGGGGDSNASPTANTNEQHHTIELAFRWRTERQKLMGRAGGMNVFDSELSVLQPTREPQTLLSLTDCICEFDDQLFNTLYNRFVAVKPTHPVPPILAAHNNKQSSPPATAAAGGLLLSKDEFIWFVSWALTHPSDAAFDAISGALSGNPPTQFE